MKQNTNDCLLKCVFKKVYLIKVEQSLMITNYIKTIILLVFLFSIHYFTN